MNWFKKKENQCEHVYFAAFNSLDFEMIKRNGSCEFNFLLTCSKCGDGQDIKIKIDNCRGFDSSNQCVEFYKTTVLMRLAGKYKIMNKIDF